MRIIRFDRTVPETGCVLDCSVLIDREDAFCVATPSFGCIDGSVKSLSGDGIQYDFALSERGEFLLVGEASYHIVNGDFEQSVARLIPLSRSEADDSDFFRQQFVELNDGLLFVYESGLIRFDGSFRVVWQQHHRRLDWFFNGIVGRFALYESEQEGSWVIELATGHPQVG